MEAIVSIVEKKCFEEMEAYSACVNKHSESWQEKCIPEKTNLNKCSSQHSVIKNINKKCTKEFQQYDACLLKNSINPQKCAAELELFSLCAEEVAALDEDLQPKT